MAITTLNLRGINRSDTASSGQVITATSAVAADFQDAGGGAWTFIKSQTASGAGSVEFNHGTASVVLDSTYVMYKLIAYDITATTDDSNTTLVLSTDAGSSYITSGYDTVMWRVRDGTSGAILSSADAMNLNNIGNSTNEEGAFEFTIINPSSGSTFAKYWFTATTRDALARVYIHHGAGMYEATSDIDGFKILQHAGNISGTFKLYGLTGA